MPTTATYTSKTSGAKIIHHWVGDHSYWKNTPYAAYGYKSKRAKKSLTIGYYATETERAEACKVWMLKADELEADKQTKMQARRDAKKAESANAKKGFKVGDIVYSSWGYEQTNIDFYRITKRTKCFATLQPLGSSVVNSPQWAVDNVVPGGELTGKQGEPFRGRIGVYGGKETSINVKYQVASLWNGNPLTQSNYH